MPKDGRSYPLPQNTKNGKKGGKMKKKKKKDYYSGSKM